MGYGLWAMGYGLGARGEGRGARGEGLGARARAEATLYPPDHDRMGIDLNALPNSIVTCGPSHSGGDTKSLDCIALPCALLAIIDYCDPRLARPEPLAAGL